MKKEIAEKKQVKIIGIGLFFILVLFIAWLAVNKSTGKKALDSKYQELIKTDNFLASKDNKYYLINQNGKKVNKEVYESATMFFNGVAAVKEEGKKAKVINEKGKVIFDGKDYEDVSYGNGIIQARKKNKYTYFNSDGKELKFLKDFEAYPFEYSGVKLVTQFKSKDKYVLVNYAGKQIYESKTPLKINPLYEGNMPTFYHGIIVDGGKNTVYNFLNNTELYKDESGKNMNIISISDDDEKTFTYENKDNSPLPKYGYVKKGKLEYEVSNLSNLEIRGRNVIAKVGNNKEYFLDNKGKIDTPLNDKAYYDNKHYAYNDKYQLVIQSGKEEKKYKCKTLVSTGYEPQGYYITRHSSAGSCKGENLYYIIDYKGKQLSNIGYYSISSFGRSHLAIATDKGNNYFLIDKKGSKRSKEYEKMVKQVVKNRTYYIAKKEGKVFVLDANNKVVLNVEARGVDIMEMDDKIYFVVEKSEKYSLYDAIKKKYVVEDIDAFRLGHNALYVISSDDIYTYSGKLVNLK